MKAPLLACLSMLAAFSAFASDLWRDPTVPLEQRLDDLMSRMTPEERTAQLLADWFNKNDSPPVPIAGAARIQLHGRYFDAGVFLRGATRLQIAEAANRRQREIIEGSRLGVPQILHEEALHGLKFGDTCFPMPIAMAATFDVDLQERAAKVIAEDCLMSGVRQILSPTLNLARDPRWGRMEETFGESAALASAMGVAFIKPIESRGIVCSMKHFVANYGEDGLDSRAVFIHESELRNYWLRPFEAAVKKAGARSVMASYNSLNGLPAHANRWLLTTVLREDWGMQGFTVADYNGWNVGWAHEVAVDEGQSFRAVWSAGLNLLFHNSASLLPEIRQLVEAGAIPQSLIDERCREVLRTKLEIGLIDNPYADLELAAARDANRSVNDPLEDEAYAKSIVLLKNTGILPLDRGKVRRIGVWGPAANRLNFGGYSRERRLDRHELRPDVTPLDGLKMVAGGGIEIVNLAKEANPLEAASSCEVLVYFATVREAEGVDRPFYELPSSEDLDVKKPANTAPPSQSGEGAFIHDRTELAENVGGQNLEILRLAATGRPVVVCLVAGSPVGVSPFLEKVGALVMAWKTNSRGAVALAKILFGDINPGGRLPVTWPKHAGQIPMHHDEYPSGRAPRVYGHAVPEFPFGIGLSYTNFSFENLELGKSGRNVIASFTVSNRGSRPGDAVAQLYIREPATTVVRPRRELKKFARIGLEPGQSKRIELELAPEDIAHYDAEGKFRHAAGPLTVFVGDSAAHTPLEGAIDVEAWP